MYEFIPWISCPALITKPVSNAMSEEKIKELRSRDGKAWYDWFIRTNQPIPDWVTYRPEAATLTGNPIVDVTLIACWEVERRRKALQTHRLKSRQNRCAAKRMARKQINFVRLRRRDRKAVENQIHRFLTTYVSPPHWGTFWAP